MRRQHRLSAGRQAAAGQLDLFGLAKTLRPVPGLNWRQLPEEARQTVIRLMARLLSGHAGDDGQPRLPRGRRDV
jgi:hypothetical protein